MSDDKVLYKTGLPKLTNNDTNNNYSKWATEAYHKLDEWDLLKYIEGPLSDPPVIPLYVSPQLTTALIPMAFSPLSMSLHYVHSKVFNPRKL